MVSEEYKGEEKNQRKNIKVSEETHEQLTQLSVRMGLPISVIISVLVEQAIKYDLLSPNWLEKLKDSLLDTEREKLKLELEKELYLYDLREASKQRDRLFSLSKDLIINYLKTLKPEERRQWLESQFRKRRILEFEEPQAIPELTQGKIKVLINGKTLYVTKLDESGMPVLEFNNDRLIRCETGFHTIGTWCYSCHLITSCPIPRQERLEQIGRDWIRRELIKLQASPYKPEGIDTKD